MAGIALSTIKPPANLSGMGGAQGYFTVNPFRDQSGGPAPSGSTAPAGNISFGGSGGSPGYTPDWQALIQGDPGLQQSMALLSGGSIADKASRDAAIGQGFAQFGDVNAGNNLDQLAQQTGLDKGDLQSILTPQVLKAAQDNTAAGTSTLARLQADNAKQQIAIKNALNARGLLNSGETGYELGQQQQNFTNSNFDARSALLKAIQGYQQGYLQGQLQRQQAEAQAYSDAAGRAFQNNQSIAPTPGTPSTQAHFISMDDNGNPIYSDGSSYYNADGTPYTGPGYHPPKPGQVQYGTPGRTAGVQIGAFK